MNPFEKDAHVLVKPNSGHWRIYREGKYCTLQQALLLSLNIEPDWYLDMNGQEQYIFNMLKWAEYRARLKTAKSLGVAGALWIVEPSAPLEEGSFIDLLQFAKLVKANFQWDVPVEFLELNGLVKPPAPKKEADWVTLAVAEFEKLYKTLDGAGVTLNDIYGRVAKSLDEKMPKANLKKHNPKTIQLHEEIIKAKDRLEKGDAS